MSPVSAPLAALEAATGQVTAARRARHRHQEFPAFLRQAARACPGQDLHPVMDNHAADKHADPRARPESHPRVKVHFTPARASWMTLVEVGFSITERQAIHRGSHTGVQDLNAKICAFITGWNDRARPFTWTKTPEQILSKANRKKTSDAEH